MSFLAVLDPAWPSERGGGRIKRGADKHYALAVNVDQLAAEYKRSEPWRDVGPGLLWLWATSSAVVLGDAHALARALGFRICAGFVWCKVDVIPALDVDGVPRASNNGEAFTPTTRMGLGQWSRCEHEHLLLCRRGKVSVPPTEARRRSVIYAPRGAHSAKPEAAWRVIETVSRAVIPGVRGIEWNARTQREGWGAYGRLDGEDKPVRWAP
jgi:N6-adenosine-specific RNA methylase IME4